MFCITFLLKMIPDKGLVHETRISSILYIQSDFKIVYTFLSKHKSLFESNIFYEIQKMYVFLWYNEEFCFR